MRACHHARAMSLNNNCAGILLVSTTPTWVGDTLQRLGTGQTALMPYQMAAYGTTGCTRNVSDGLQDGESHEWVKVEAGTATVGTNPITIFCNGKATLLNGGQSLRLWESQKLPFRALTCPCTRATRTTKTIPRERLGTCATSIRSRC